jgi:hypothetical protein
MKKFCYFVFIFTLFSFSIYAQKTEVLTLGSFHFNFPNLDVEKVSKEDQIDVLESKYQKEIGLIVNKLAKFKPTIIVIEREPSEQSRIDGIYNDYLQGKYELKRHEEEQIGFRLGKLLGIKQLHCVDSDGRYYIEAEKLLNNRDTPESKKLIDFISNNPDSSKMSFPKMLLKTKGILATLKQLNSAEQIKKDLGSYLIGVFKYETPDNNNFGPDFVSGWWFNRNLRIFRNIQKINPKATDRILVIFGAGHMNLLNPFFDASPEYKLLKVNDFLK